MKNRSHRYDINIPRPRHVHRYTKCKMCLSIIMVLCVKQRLSNIWSSIHEKIKQYWGWVEKKALLISKKSVYWFFLVESFLLPLIFRFKNETSLKVLMQIWKSSWMFRSIQKSYLENFAFLILIIIKLFTREVCAFHKT